MTELSQFDLTTVQGLQDMLEVTPIHRWLGFRIETVDIAAGTLFMSANATENFARFDGADQAHGGAIATLIDSCATFACSAAIGKPVPTMNMRVDYLRPAGGGVLIAHAEVVKLGRTVTLVDVKLIAGEKLAAVGRCGQASG